MAERHQCEVCNRWYFRHKSNGKFCTAKCRQFAFQNRKRVLKRASGYTLSDRQLDDVKTIQGVSHEAASVVLKVCSVGGQALASEVLDGMWSLLVHTGFMDKAV